jgi:hypothetical protein
MRMVLLDMHGERASTYLRRLASTLLDWLLMLGRWNRPRISKKDGAMPKKKAGASLKRSQNSGLF